MKTCYTREQIETTVKSKGYKWFTGGSLDKDYDVNIVGVRNSDTNNEITNKIIPLKIKLRGVEWSRIKCCWPEGDPKQNDFKFCGKEIFPGRPYCDKHSLIAYTNSRENS